jgi:glycosyltransferase involved in cell wall biosynthesis
VNKSVIFCTDSPGFGGSEINLMKLTGVLKSSCHISFITAPNPCEQLNTFIAGNKIKHARFGVSNNIRQGLFGIVKAIRCLKRHEADVYIFWCHHINSNRWLQLAAAILGKKFIVVEQLLPAIYRKPFVSLPARVFKKFIVARAYRVVICGYSQENSYQLNFRTKNTLVIPNTRDVEHIFREVGKLRNNEHSKSDFVICCIGRLSDQKNQETLVEAFGILKTNRNIKLLLVGDGENRYKIEKQISDNDIENVTITGFTEDVYPFLAISDLFVLPSFYEGLPGALIEAMAAKVPCIVSNIPGNNELIVNAVTGYSFEPGNVHQLSGLIEFLIANPKELKKIAESGFNKVLSEYNEQIEMESWKKLLAI